MQRDADPTSAALTDLGYPEAVVLENSATLILKTPGSPSSSLF